MSGEILAWNNWYTWAVVPIGGWATVAATLHWIENGWAHVISQGTAIFGYGGAFIFSVATLLGIWSIQREWGGKAAGDTALTREFMRTLYAITAKLAILSLIMFLLFLFFQLKLQPTGGDIFVTSFELDSPVQINLPDDENGNPQSVMSNVDWQAKVMWSVLNSLGLIASVFYWYLIVMVIVNMAWPDHKRPKGERINMLHSRHKII